MYGLPFSLAFPLAIEATPTNRTACEGCIRLIDRGLLRAKVRISSTKLLYYHLYCYTPESEARLQPEALTIKVEEDQEQEVRDWVDNWNKRFEPKVLEFREKYGRKKVHSSAGKNRRALIEAFKYLDRNTVVGTAGVVNKEWYHIAWEDEIWQNLIPSQPPSAQSLRSQYIEDLASTCPFCSSLLSPCDSQFLCPVTSRPICLSCIKNQGAFPQPVDDIAGRYYLTAYLIRMLPVPKFQYRGQECTYPNLVNSRIAKPRKVIADFIASQRSPKVEKLFKREMLDFLGQTKEEDFGLMKFHYYGYRLLTDAQRELFQFIAMCNPVESFNQFLANFR